MFLGESSMFIFYLIRYFFGKIRSNPYVNMEAPSKARSFKEKCTLLLFFCLFAFFDLVGTTVAAIGLLYVPASAFQLLRGCIILFTETESIMFLKQRCIGTRWLGISIVS